MTKAKNNKPPLIYGDGEQTRDFTYIKDGVQANIQVALSEKADGEIMNTSGGKRITINELAETIMEMFEGEQKPEHIDPRKGDVKHSLADITKAKKLIGYEPTYDLKKGLNETKKYFI